jgi:hypothetical protein
MVSTRFPWNMNLSRTPSRRSVYCFFLLWAVGFPVSVFNALAIVDANSSSNTSPPSDGAPWGNVGTINGASGVYIGAGWVLTAAHVGAGTINLGGTMYAPNGASVRLTNTDGTVTDLVLFHLSTLPPLPSIPLVSSTPAALSQIDVIGFGHLAGSAQTNFGLYSGFYLSAGTAKSWGNNKVNIGGTTTIDIGYGTVTAFISDFTAPGTLGPTSPTSDEAQVSAGDSGGGVFQKNGSTWLLAGILDAEQNQVNQPDSTAVYGDKSYFVDIATYRSEILSVLNSSAVPNLLIARTATNALVCWPDTGISYELESSSSLSGANWPTVSSIQFTTNGQICVAVTTTASPRFFRLKKP